MKHFVFLFYRVFFNEESKVSGPKSIQNSVLYADFELIFMVIVANLILYPKIHSQCIFELIFSYEKRKVKIWDIDFSVHFEVVALVKRGHKLMKMECCIHTNCLIFKEN